MTTIATSLAPAPLDLSDGRLLAPGESARVIPTEHEHAMAANGVLRLDAPKTEPKTTKRRRPPAKPKGGDE